MKRRAAEAALVDPAVTALAETHGFSGQEQHAIITLIRDQTIRTHSVEHACSVVVARMGSRDFDWPEFERWHAVFTERGHFPPLWSEVERRPGQEAPEAAWQAYRHRKLYLLIDWLHGLVVTRAEMRAAVTRYAVLGLTAEITRQSREVTCPACDRPHDPLHHWSDVPPFHPGCRCVILAAARASGRHEQSRRA